ncbi:hypothetical protein HYC85_017757 [Camellia sinensis]|uniref:Leucine-rich repeat-containing N-terminal plant-type domain-containing protein n=1 Tax=Camellia sinensis TaxID=4442 RepID=A0A7J7GSK0_CAMSI|nr:hypothetical protein HYC85_017757 [Camellia sinensis]
MSQLSLLLLCFFIYIQNLNFTHSLSSDGLSLFSLKSVVDHGGAGAFSDWNKNDSTPCRWTEISCTNISGFSDPRVSISGDSTSTGNNFYGSIPDQLFNASSLHSLFLYGNNLSGSLHHSLYNLPRLQNLDLSNNSISGPIPKDLRNCRKQQHLILARNKFSGEISAGIWPEMANLVQLDLSSNNFSGSILKDIGELKSLSGTLNLS